MSKSTDSSAILETVSNAIVNVADKLSPSVVRIGAGRWRGGTGTVWSRDGHIVTSNHVLGRTDEVEVGFSDGTKHVAKVVGRDPYSDIALLKIDSDHLSPVEAGDSDALKVGQFVLALANPMGRHPSATYGIAMGDVVVKLDGKQVEDIMDLHEMLDDKAIGKRVKLSVLRGEKLIELTATPTESEQ